MWPHRLEQPFKWKRPRMIFVNSMSDLFHPEIPFEFVRQVFSVMTETPHHTYQVLTKRHEYLAEVASELPWPSNVWMGVSIENKRWICRADHLRTVPAAVRFISAEPLLGPLTGLDLKEIDWLIAGGESGHKARPVNIEWLRALRDQCLNEGVAFFFKQWGGRTPKAGGRELDRREWSQLPVTEVSSVRAKTGGRRSSQVGVHRAHSREARDSQAVPGRLVLDSR
jgi:protein gp37